MQWGTPMFSGLTETGCLTETGYHKYDFLRVANKTMLLYVHRNKVAYQGRGRGVGVESERVKARPRTPPDKDRKDRGPPPEQWNC